MWYGCVAFSAADHLVDVDVAQHVEKHHRGHADDGDAEQYTDPVPADRVREKPRHRAQRLEHHSSGLMPFISALDVAHAIIARATDP